MTIEQRASWDAAYINDLPDSAFACIDAEGRHYPHHDASGAVDLPHLRNALARVAQEATTSCGVAHLRAHAKAEGIGQAAAGLKLDDLAGLEPARLPFPVTRAVGDAPELELAEASDGPRMVGHFATFGQPYEVHSLLEGRFLEQIAPGAFRKTIQKSLDGRSPMRVLFDHGQDPQMGNMILGTIESLAEDRTGAAYQVGMFEGVPPLLMSGLRAGAYGSSFRFSVTSDAWDYHPEPSDANPEAIPERTITEAQVFEFGPVTFPANPNATAGVRSTTDAYYQRSRDPEQLETLLRSAQVARTPRGAAGPEPPPDTRHEPEPSRPDTPPVTPNTPSTPKEKRTVEYLTREDKAARVEELKAALQRMAVEHPGVLPDAAQREWDGHREELRSLEDDIRAWDERVTFIGSLAGDEKRAVPANVDAPAVIRRPATDDIYDIGRLRNETRSREEFEQRVRDNALRSIEGARLSRNANLDALVELIDHRDEGTDGRGELARRVLLTGSPVYRRAFNKYLRGETALWTPEEARAAALAVTGTTTTGGYAVPYVFDPTLIHIGAWTEQNPFRSACRIETITNGNNWRAVTVGAVAAAYGTEASTNVEGGPTFGQPTYTVQTAKAFVTVSVETMEDRPDISTELSAVFAESKDTLEENQFAVGVGTTVFPLGMFATGSYTTVNTGTVATTALTDFTAVEAATPLRYRYRAVWFMNRATLRTMLALDTTWRYFSGAGIQFPGQQNPVRNDNSGYTGLSLLGYPIYEVPSAVSTTTTTGSLIAALVDPKTYVIVDRIGMNVEVIPQMLDGATPSFPTLQRGIICYWRNTAKPINVDGGRVLKVA